LKEVQKLFKNAKLTYLFGLFEKTQSKTRILFNFEIALCSSSLNHWYIPFFVQFCLNFTIAYLQTKSLVKPKKVARFSWILIWISIKIFKKKLGKYCKFFNQIFCFDFHQNYSNKSVIERTSAQLKRFYQSPAKKSIQIETKFYNTIVLNPTNETKNRNWKNCACLKVMTFDKESHCCT